MFGQKEKVYFLHIPRTSGTSIRYWLWDAFSVEDFLECYHLADLYDVNVPGLERARLYSGHFGTRLCDFIKSRPITLTFLRDPVERVCSEILYLRTRSAQEIRDLGSRTWAQPAYFELVRMGDVSRLFSSKVYVEGFANMHLRFLGGDPPNGALSAVSRATYDRARQTLENLDAFGIFERMPESLMVFCERLCWPPRTLPLRLNEARESAPDAFGLALRDATPFILETNSWDVRLYDFARELFEHRFSFLRSKLGVSGHPEPDNDAKMAAIKSAALERFLDTPFSGQPLRYGRISQSQGLFLEGWAERVYWPPVKRWLRWASRAETSTLYLPLDRTRGAMTLRFELFYPSDDNVLQQLRLEVDGGEVELVRMDVKQGNEIYFHAFEAILPGFPRNAARRWTALSWVTTHHHAEKRSVPSAKLAPKFALANIDIF